MLPAIQSLSCFRFATQTCTLCKSHQSGWSVFSIRSLSELKHCLEMEKGPACGVCKSFRFDKYARVDDIGVLAGPPIATIDTREQLKSTKCNIQDWDTEASRMAIIYANAWLSIRASRSSSANQGFLEDFVGPSQRAILLEWTDDQIVMAMVPPDYNPRSARVNEPLLSRGWALQ